MSCYYYLDTLFTIESKERVDIDKYQLKQIILYCIKTLFGEAGLGNQVDILKYEEKEGRIILRCFSDFYVKLRAALALSSKFENITFSFHTTKASASLLSLQSSSRTYQF